MGERSPLTKILLFLILVVLGFGVYSLIDVLDRNRHRLERMSKQLQEVQREVSSLRDGLTEGRFTVGQASTPAQPGSATPGKTPGKPRVDTPPQPKRPRFANLNIRDPKAVVGGRLIGATSAETKNLNYLVNNEAQVGDFWGLTCDSLAARNMEHPTRWEPQLATDWELADDKLTWTIHLRKRVYWHDFTDPTTGKSYTDVEVTAHDFKFYLDVVRNPGVNCEAIRVYYKDLEGIEIIDDYTFRVVWREPYFLSETFTLGLNPLPRHFYRFDPKKPDEFNNNTKRNRMIVGCGPWIFSGWEKGKEFVFLRNERYYGPKPYLLVRRLKVIKEPSASLQALRKGEVDRIGLLPDQWVDQTNDAAFKANQRKFKYPARVYRYIGYNLKRPPFGDRRVRLALTHLVDRERILKDVFRGLGRIVTGNFFVDSPYYDNTIKPWPFSIAKAKELLDKAGWRDTDGDGIRDRGGRKLEFTLLTVSSSKTQVRYAAIVKEDMAKAGVVMKIQSVEWSVYTQRLEEKNFDVCTLGWSMGYDSDPYQIWHSSGAKKKNSSNHIGFMNAEADRIIMEARREFDVEKRIKLYNRFHQLIHEEQPYTFLICPYALVAQSKRYRNARVYPLGMDANTFWVPVEEQIVGD